MLVINNLKVSMSQTILLALKMTKVFNLAILSTKHNIPMKNTVIAIVLGPI